MKRRDFIRLGGFLTASAATVGLTGCSLDDDDNELPAHRPSPQKASGSNWQFPQSIASADPEANSIILWTRVIPTGLAPTVSSTTDVTIRLVVTQSNVSHLLQTDTDIANTTLVADVSIPAYADFDNTIRHKLSGLRPSTVYFYQFIAGNVRSNVGRFKTAPAATDSNDVKFIFMSCQDWSANHWGAFDQIIADDLSPADPDIDFIVHLGDYIYETDSYSSNDTEAGHTAPDFPMGADLPGGSKYAVALGDYRYLYKLYRSDPRLQAMHERFPMIAIWDDHEFSDDSWQASETYTNYNLQQPARRRFANQAWFEYMPARISFSAEEPGFHNIRIYRDLKFGSVMHLVMTDERLYKADHLIPETTQGSSGQIGRINSRYLAPEATLKVIEQNKVAASPDDPLKNVSILGGTQRQWWKDTMARSTATWKVWGNEVSLLRMGLHGTNALATLLSLNYVPTLTTSIGDTASSVTGGNIPEAAAIVGASSFQALNATAVAAATAIDAAGGTDTDKLSAATGAGLTLQQAQVAVAAYNAGAGGALSAAQIIAMGFIKADIQAHEADSVFFIQSLGSFASLAAPFFDKFMLNADQWDGYRKERAALMNHLLDNNIRNVVAVTGDIHAFFAGQVYNEFPGETLTVTSNGKEASASPVAPSPLAGTPAMVDLVVAGISSTSWFNYIKEAADSLDPFNFLIGKLVYIPLPVPAIGSLPAFTLSLNMMDYTMGRPIDSSGAIAAGQLASQLTDQLKRKLAELGVAEADIDSMTNMYIGTIAASASTPGSDFATAIALAQQLSALGKQTNPWLSHVDTEAQGYAVVTASTGSLTCTFRKVNPLVGTAAPMTGRIIRDEVTATVMAGTTAVVIS